MRYRIIILVGLIIASTEPPYTKAFTEFQQFDSALSQIQTQEWSCNPSWRGCKKEFYLTKRINNRSDINPVFYCPQYEYKLYFEPSEVIFFCNKTINRLKKKDGDKDSVQHYKQLLKLAKRSLRSVPIKFDDSWMDIIISECRPFIKNTKTKRNPKALIVRFYKTQSNDRGKDFDVITAKNDTVNMVTYLPICMN